MNNAERNYIVDKALETVNFETTEDSRGKLSHKISELYREKRISMLEM